MVKLAGKTSRRLSGVGSVALVPMYSHFPAGAPGVELVERPGVWGRLPAPGFEAGLPSEVTTRMAVTAAMITTAVAIASRTGWCLDLRLVRGALRRRAGAARRPVSVGGPVRERLAGG